jgi:ABC-2 type transport system ATP-binding protein
MIKATNLTKNYGEQRAVDIPELIIPDGTILGLVGNNGAGKTTLFRLLLDLIKATDGEVGLSKSDDCELMNPAQCEDWKHFVGAYVNEGFLIDFLSPEEYFLFVGKVNDIPEETVKTTIEQYTEFLTDEIIGAGKLIRDLSAGNRQKVGIVSALLAQPKIVILDEPFNFLDPSSQNKLKKLIIDYHEKTGATLLISSHNLTHTVDISTHVALMEKGKIISFIDNIDGAANKQLDEYFS